jgi:allophanate hydrolase subunit 2
MPRPLVAGDELPLGASNAGVEAAGRHLAAPAYGGTARAVAGPHDARFAVETVLAFFGAAFVVLPESDRMGVRLAGEALATATDELLTCGIVAGAVQVPRGGTPIVLLADHQTTGGYPIIATVIQADLGIVAQAAPGEYLRFERVTPGDVVRSDYGG